MEDGSVSFSRSTKQSFFVSYFVFFLNNEILTTGFTYFFSFPGPKYDSVVPRCFYKPAVWYESTFMLKLINFIERNYIV